MSGSGIGICKTTYNLNGDGGAWDKLGKGQCCKNENRRELTAMILRKRQLITGTLVLALSAAVFVNWYYTRPQSGALQTAEETVSKTDAVKNLGDAQYVISSDVNNEDVFVNERLKRQQSHDEAEEMLQEIIKDSASSEISVKEATSALTALSDRVKKETDIETLVKAKTGIDCLVVLSESGGDIILSKAPTDSATVLQITEIAVNKTSFSAENITIIELNS